MTWVKLDDRFPSHRKVALLTDRAFRLYVSAAVWTAQHQTAGLISAKAARQISFCRNPKAAAAELVAVGLWETTDSGDYRITETDLFSIERPPQYADGQRERIYKRDGHRCVICGTTEDLTLDHIHPRSRAGSDRDDNLRTLCRPCNSRKGARI